LQSYCSPACREPLHTVGSELRLAQLDAAGGA
jgi:hypothetical protein